MADEWNFEVIVDPQCPPDVAYIVPRGTAVPTQTYGCGCPIAPPGYQPRATITISVPTDETGPTRNDLGWVR
jgi:hypothetical protein